jgi:hypothetical protein
MIVRTGIAGRLWLMLTGSAGLVVMTGCNQPPRAADPRRRPCLHRGQTPGAAIDRETSGNVTRLQVSGSPEIGWVKVTVNPEPEEPFTFDKRIVRRGAVWW